MFKLADLSLSQKIYALIGLPIVCELVFVATLVAWNQGVEEGKRKEAFGRSVLAYSRRITQSLINSAKSAVVFQVSGEKVVLERLEASINKASEEFEALQSLLKKYPKYSKLGQSIGKKWELPLAELREVKRLLSIGQTEAGIERLEHVAPVVDQLNREGDKIFAPFMRLSEKGEKEQEQARQSLIVILFALLGASVVLALSLVKYFSKNLLSRLAVLLDNTVRLERAEPLQQTLSGKDEIAELDRVFHKMAKSITEAADQLRLSEAQTRTVIESMPIGVLTADKSFALQSANKTATELLGCQNDLAETPVSFARFLKERNKIPDPGAAPKELAALKMSGEEFPAEVAVTDLHGPKFDGYLINLVDISERKRIEQMKQDFLAMVSHDLRSPLASIKMTFELLAMGAFGELSEKAKKKVTIDEANCRRLISMINDLLDAQKLESGRFDIVLESTDYWTIADRSVSAVENLAQTAEVKLLVQDDKNLHFTADGDRIVQVLINLLTNAIKFSPAKGTVRLSAANEDDWIVFRVKDEGRGVPEHLRQVIFEKFRQVQADDGRKKGGTGLGLAICKGIIESHGGEIAVESEEGKGSTFWFKLPYVEKKPQTISETA